MSRFNANRTERAEADPRSLGDLFSEINGQVRELVQQEIQLAKVETRQIAQRLLKDSTLLIAGGAVAVLAVLVLTAALTAAITMLLALAVDMGVAIWLGPLITAVLLGAVAAGLLIAGRNRLKQTKMQPEQTTESLREDAQWLKRQFQ